MTQSQKEFEAWLDKYLPDHELMHSGHIEDMREAWTASRAALVVELPDAESAATNNEPSELVYIADYIHDALDASGIKYKSRT